MPRGPCQEDRYCLQTARGRATAAHLRVATDAVGRAPSCGDPKHARAHDVIHALTYFRGSVRIGQGESYLGQNPSSIRRMMLEYALCLVVADTPLAGNENHSRRAHVMQMARVVAGTGGHIHARNLQGSCGRPDGLTDCKREFEGRVVEQFVHRYCASSRGVPADLADCVSEL